MPRTRAVAIIIKDDQVLLMHRFKAGKEYWVFPGGGKETGETLEQAVVREVLEETSLEVEVEHLLYQHFYDDGSDQHYYLCNYLAGDAKLRDDSVEAAQNRLDKTNAWIPTWVSIKEAGELLLYPLEIRDWLAEDYLHNFSGEYPRIAHIKQSEKRETL